MSSNPTTSVSVAELSRNKRALLEDRLSGMGHISTIPRRASFGRAPASFAQERLWFLNRVGQGGIAYNIFVPLRLIGTFDAGSLARALAALAQRHDVLRTTFCESEGVLEQVIKPFDGFPCSLEDLSTIDNEAGEAEALGRAKAEATYQFDLVAGPLFRARLLRLAAKEHWLLLSTHHIIADGWSIRVLFRELWALYEAEREGLASPLKDLPVQYADFAIWHRAKLGGESEQRCLAYWKKQLAGAPALINLSADRPRPAAPSFHGSSIPVNIPLATRERLQTVALQEGATLYMVVLAAFKLLLSRYTGGNDIVVGTPAAGREYAELQDLIGLFMNPLVLRTSLSGDPTFREVVGRVREVVLDAYEHQDLPFGRLVEELRPERSFSHSSIFQVLFQMANTEFSEVNAEPVRGLRVLSIPLFARETTKYDLTLDLISHPQGITGALEYNIDLFESATTIQRMLDQLERILQQVATDPSVRLSAVTLLDVGERTLVLDTWNQTARAYPADQGIHELFAAQAARTPEALAVTYGSETLSYRELDRRANRLAHYLRELGVGPEVRVGFCLERSLELLVALLGVLKAGGAYVPLDRQYPPERLAYMLTDSAVPVLLVQERLAGLIPVPAGVQVICLDTAATQAALARQRDEAPASGVDAENLCYVIYTSGSTGRPKGVAMHHRGVCNYIAWGVEAYGAGEGNGAPVFTSMAVDLTITNLLPLFAGKPVHLLPEENPVEELAEVLRKRPDFGLIKITPTHLTLLTPLLTPEEARSATQTLVIGADFLMAEPTIFWQDHAPGVRLLNEYGPTETVVGCSAHVLSPGALRAGPVPVGGPIQNLRFYVLDGHREPVPIGLPGELYIGGVGMARGYLGRPGLTAEKFLPDPFGALGARMYRTGDRARWLESGTLLILGRIDHQIKLRGFRVELGEVEAVLRRHAGVKDCLVIARKTPANDTQMVAYVVGAALPTDLREHLRRHLPEYMLPSAFVTLETLPQTATGKLDHHALPPPQDPNTNRDQLIDDAPKNFIEVQLIHIWEELLGTERIGATQNFFDVGGNSLLALRLFAQIKRKLHCDLPLSTLFDNASLRGMATAILERRGSGEEKHGSIVPLQPHGTLLPLFCVHPAGRSVHGYVHLVRNLGAEQPVFGIEDRGELDRPIAQIASDHLEALRLVQPHGPYNLLGWSFGGCVAYEMALQLEQEGQTVAFLGLMDTMEPMLWHGQSQLSDLDLVFGLAGDVAAQMSRPFSICREQLEGISLDQQCRVAAEELCAQGAVPGDLSATWLSEGIEIIRARHRSGHCYTPGRLRSTLTLFRPNEIPIESSRIFTPFSEEEQRTLCWCRLVEDRVEVHRIPGGHVTMGSEPNVRMLAQRVRESLAAAQTRER